MNDLVYRVALLVGWFVIVMVTSFLWTAVKVVSDNSMTKHKKVCDLCFRNIKLWNAEYKNIKVLHRSVEDIKEAVVEDAKIAGKRELLNGLIKTINNYRIDVMVQHHVSYLRVEHISIDNLTKRLGLTETYFKEILAALKIDNKGEK